MDTPIELKPGPAVARTLIAVAMLTALASGQVLAHGDAGHESKAFRAISTDEQEFGREGDPKHLSRTVKIDMSDKLRYTPARLEITQGETVKFVVKNNGNSMHEMVLGTMAELREHAKIMRKHPTMEHDEPFMAHVAPGKSQTMVWQFTKAGEFYFGCLVPGHFEGGMIGKIRVLAKGDKK